MSPAVWTRSNLPPDREGRRPPRPPTALSAEQRFAPWQRVAVAVTVLGLFAGVGAAPRPTLTVLLALGTGVYVWVVGYKAVLITRAWRHNDRPLRPDPLLSDDDLPSYTVLVPLYQEANVVAPLADALARLDYPAHLLQILFLCEHDDPQTIAAVRGVAGEAHVDLVIVPEGVPRTKPRACNVGLQRATGSLLVIYDAEDRPDPDQLRLAATAFARTGPDVACLQARLDYHNHRANWLTAWFTNEYNYWFDLLLPALSRRHLPLPLGGTSNHFRTDVLRDLGGWDPFNVTEDADLGIRLYRAGARTELLDSVTREEATSHLAPWIRQRTRWMKGYLQTSLVHTRDLGWLRGRRHRIRALTAFLVVVPGTPLVNLMNPIFWGLFLAHLVTKAEAITALFPAPVLYVGSVNLVVGNLLFILVNLLAAERRSRWHLGRAAVTAPIYWLLMSLATWRAAWQFIRAPHRWEKTPHGLSPARVGGGVGRAWSQHTGHG